MRNGPIKGSEIRSPALQNTSTLRQAISAVAKKVYFAAATNDQTSLKN
jgi:hypothetical protein